MLRFMVGSRLVTGHKAAVSKLLEVPSSKLCSFVFQGGAALKQGVSSSFHSKGFSGGLHSSGTTSRLALAISRQNPRLLSSSYHSATTSGPLARLVTGHTRRFTSLHKRSVSPQTLRTLPLQSAKAARTLHGGRLAQIEIWRKGINRSSTTRGFARSAADPSSSMGVSMSLIGGFLALDLGIQWVCWGISSTLQTEKFYDLVGSGSFLTMAVLSLFASSTFFPRQLLITGLVATWAGRLGSHLFERVMKEGKDSRFDGVRSDPATFFVYWTIQAGWVFLVSLPVLLINLGPAGPPLRALDALGIGIWILGFGTEAIADHQKKVFRDDPANKGQWIDSGLWSVSRHPNYLGEIVLWWGVYLLAFRGLHTPAAKVAGALSPVFTTYLLTQLSGVPMLERASDKRWGSNPEYQEYKKRTPALIPLPFNPLHKKSP